MSTAMHEPALRVAAKRYSQLRAALGALTWVQLGIEEQLEDAFRGIQQSLRRLAREDSDTGASEVAAVGSDLDLLGTRLRAHLLEIPLPRLRASVQELLPINRDEVCALLDVCLANVEDSARSWPYVEYLVTSLSVEKVSGRKHLARDPVSITPRLDEISSRAEVAAGESCSGLALEIRAAREDLERCAPVHSTVDRVSSLKRSCTPLLFAAPVLREVIRYNAAVWNCIRDYKESQRTLAELEDLGEESGSDRFEPCSDVLRSEGLLAIHEALRARLSSSPGPSGAGAEIAELLSLSSLSKFEERVLRGGGDETWEHLCATATAVRIVAKDLDALSDRLLEMGIDPEILGSEWTEELAELLRDEVRLLLAQNRYGEGRHVAELRTRLLRARDSTGPPLLAPDLASAAPVYSPSPSSAGRRPKGRLSARPEAREEAGRSRRPWIVAAVLVLAFATVGLAQLRAPGRSNVEIYSEAELHMISPMLSSGYRNGHGAGPLFIGTLDDRWHELPRSRRPALAREIAEALGDDGVTRVMLFDQRRALRVHFAEGRLNYPPSGL